MQQIQESQGLINHFEQILVVPIKPPPAFVTFELTPTDAQRTQLSMRVRVSRRDWFTRQMFRLFMKPAFNKEYDFEYSRLDRVLAAIVKSNEEVDELSSTV